MTLYEFNYLDEQEQIEAIWDAVEIGKRKDDVYEYNLYQIGSFYAELKYNIERKFIRSIKSFKTTDLLTPYLDDIDISEIK